MTNFSDKVGVFLFVLGKRDSVFPEIIASTFVGLASVFQLGDGRFLLLLLSKVLGECQGVILFFWFSVPARTTLWFAVISCRGGNGIAGSTPIICSSSSSRSARAPRICRGIGGTCSGPVASCIGGSDCRAGVPVVCVRLDCSIYGGGLLSVEFGIAIVATPALMNLLVGVAGMGVSSKERE